MTGPLTLKAALFAFLAGGASVLAYAPFGWFPLVLLSLGLLVWLLDDARSARAGFMLGGAWGLGAFLVGVSWLYIALNRYGGVPMPVAGLAIFLFCSYLALYPALAAAIYVRLRPRAVWARAAAFAGLWVVFELLRGWVFTGFPWLAVGYTQTPPGSLAGFLPVLGVYGTGGILALAAAWLAGMLRARRPLAAVALPLLLAGSATGLAQLSWTTPQGEPLRVALVQTNIEQDLKWEPGRMRDWLEVNAELADVHGVDLVVLPETTLPMLVDQLPDGYLDYLSERARDRDSDLIAGVFARDEQGHIYNAALSMGRAPGQFYAKRHLVPFGEYSPPLFGWFYRVADIPMSDQTPGPRMQPPMQIGGQQVALNICYEDLFGRELLDFLPEATLMLNISNLAWYGESFAQPQHLQIAQARALETGRPMLRSTNTGMTALIQPDGRVEAVMPQFERGVLEVEVRGHVGLTPYARWGDAAALALALIALGTALWARRRRAGFDPARESQ